MADTTLVVVPIQILTSVQEVSGLFPFDSSPQEMYYALKPILHCDWTV